MAKNVSNISILGSAGGVARALLAILNKSVEDINDPIHALISSAKLHLVDHQQRLLQYYQKKFPNLSDLCCIYSFNVKNLDLLKEHLIKTQTTLVIDCSFADTVETLSLCNELNIDYINTAFENTMIDEDESYDGFGLIERYQIFESNRQDFNQVTAIIGSGMNPGVVQWMALELMKANPEEKPMGCFIVEQDDSFYADRKRVREDTLYTTWSTECFLDEAILGYPMFLKHRTPLFLYEHVYNLEFKVSLGDKHFSGCLMAHEEVVTLGKLFDMETGFIYKVNDHTSEIIRRNLDNVDDLWNWNMEVLDPEKGELIGEDLVGVLLVYPDKERYMYNILSNQEVFNQYKVSATYFQVASGIYGALSTFLLDDLPPGIYYVDELLLNTSTKYGEYLKYHLKDFVVGENNYSEGGLLDRMFSRTEKG